MKNKDADFKNTDKIIQALDQHLGKDVWYKA